MWCSPAGLVCWGPGFPAAEKTLTARGESFKAGFLCHLPAIITHTFPVFCHPGARRVLVIEHYRNAGASMRLHNHGAQ